MNARLVKLLGVAGIAILLVVGYFFVLSPYLSESGRLSEEIETTEQRNSTLRTQITSVARNAEYIDQVAEFNDLMNERFPSTAAVDSLRGQIYSAAANADVTVNVDTTTPSIINAPEPGAAPAEAAPAPADNVPTDDLPDAPADQAPAAEGAAPEQGAGNLAEISLPITAQGSLENLTNFLQQLSQIDRGILVSGVSVTGGGSSDSEDDAEATYSLTLDAKTFLYRDIPAPHVESPDEDSADDTQ